MTQTEKKSSLGLTRQIPGDLRSDHRAARKGDNLRSKPDG